MEIVCGNCHRKSTPIAKWGWVLKYYHCRNCGQKLNIEDCNVCGALISNRAFTCPQCGDPKNRRQ